MDFSFAGIHSRNVGEANNEKGILILLISKAKGGLWNVRRRKDRSSYYKGNELHAENDASSPL